MKQGADLDLLRTVADAIPRLVVVYDRDLRCRFVNSMAREWFGKPPGEIVGLHLREILGPQVFEAQREQIAAVLRGEVVEHERRVTKSNGHVADAIAEYRPHVVDGRVEGMVVLVTDVTETRRAERAAEARFTRAFRAGPTPLLIRRISDDRIVEANAQFEALTGIPRGEIIGRAAGEIIGWSSAASGAAHREQIAARKELIARANAEGSVSNVEMRLTTKDGETRIVLVSTETVDFGEDGPCAFVSLVDDTKRRLAERRLALQSDVSRILAESNALAEAAPRILRAMCEAEGWSVGAVWERSGERLQCVDVWSKDDPALEPLVAQTRALSFTRGEGGPGRVWLDVTPRIIPDVSQDPSFRRADAARDAGLRSAVLFPIHQGSDVFGVIDFIGYFPPIDPQLHETLSSIGAQIGLFTERVQRQQLAEENRRIHAANQAKSAFLANMSHELRTPLNAIIGFTSIIRDGKAGPVGDLQREYLGDVLGSSSHLLSIINDLLDLAKIESGKTELRPRDVDMERLVAEVRDSLRGISAERRHRLSTDVVPSVRHVVVSERCTKQILFNLLSNAIKFTPEGGHITIRVAPVGDDMFRLEVEDTGEGISESDRSHLFDEFHRLRRHAVERVEGTGLGLAITRRLAEAQGGSADASSIVGRGSCFFVTLPRVVRAA